MKPPHHMTVAISSRTRGGKAYRLEVTGPSGEMLAPLVHWAARGGPYTWLYYLALVGGQATVYGATGSLWLSWVFVGFGLWRMGTLNEWANRERVVERWARHALVLGDPTLERDPGLPRAPGHLTIPGGLEY